MGVLSTPAAGAGFGNPDEIVHGRPRKAWHRDRLAAQRYLLRLIEESGVDCDLQEGVVVLAPLSSARAFTADPASAATGERAGVLEGEMHYVEDVAGA